ncbi:MAG: enoyl-CoA hydratase-related protein [Aestuariivirga sp.]
MSEALVLQSRSGAVATITLNHPDKANVLSLAMMDALQEAVEKAGADDSTHVIVLAANGRLFCAGHNLAELQAQPDAAHVETLFQRCTALMSAIRELPKPVMAKVQNSAMAAGCQLVAVCDLAYAAEGAKFGLNGINLGLFCSTPSVAVSRSMAPRQALELAMTGNLITAARAAELGLINEAFPAAMLDEEVRRRADDIAAKDPQSLALGKKLFWQQAALPEAEAYALAGKAMATNMQFSPTRQKIAGFLNKR